MATTEIKSGDVVQLKSGGANMTVSGTDGKTATCVWFEGKPPQQKQGNFPVITLVKMDPSGIFMG